jgi:FlaA1/EpsC-like NDP-sugar epimerase
VPLMEEFPRLAVMTNAFGTYELMRALSAMGCERFVLVSTDKAVKPTSVMGASKLLAERLVRSMGVEHDISTCSVRFGNVIGSRGSVVPLFDRQIATGGPVTVTNPRATRYFMTVSEAVSLILQAGSMGHAQVVYMLDMGEPISIDELAKRMIRLRGLEPGRDIEIVYTGLRAGEKLAEDLSYDFEVAEPTSHSKIRLLCNEGAEQFESSALAMVLELWEELVRPSS